MLPLHESREFHGKCQKDYFGGNHCYRGASREILLAQNFQEEKMIRIGPRSPLNQGRDFNFHLYQYMDEVPMKHVLPEPFV